MSGQRAVRAMASADDVDFLLPEGAPEWCDVLVMSERKARRVIKPWKRYSIAPDRSGRRRYAAAVQCRHVGGPFIVYGANDRCHGIFGRWADAATALVGLATAYAQGGRR